MHKIIYSLEKNFSCPALVGFHLSLRLSLMNIHKLREMGNKNNNKNLIFQSIIIQFLQFSQIHYRAEARYLPSEENWVR